MSIPVFKPSIRRRDMHSVLSCLVTDIIGPAAISEDLVAVAAADFNLEGGVAMREYARSIEMIIRAMGLERGDKAVLSPLAPAAYHLVFRVMGIEPVYADVREEDACLNPESVAERADEHTKAVFVHAPLGRVPAFSELAELGLPLIIDAGEALGARFEGAEIGSFGKYVLLPMEPEGIATAGGGSLVLASDKEALSRLKEALDNGWRRCFYAGFECFSGTCSVAGISAGFGIEGSDRRLFSPIRFKGPAPNVFRSRRRGTPDPCHIRFLLFLLRE